MSSHSWLLTITIALCATVICAGGKSSLPLTDDPMISKILSTTEESKTPKWAPDPNIPLADDPRYVLNKILCYVSMIKPFGHVLQIQ